MKKLLVFIAVSLFATTIVFADTGSGRQVSRTPVEVKKSTATKQLKEVRRTPAPAAEQTEPVVQQTPSQPVVVRQPAPARSVVQPAMQERVAPAPAPAYVETWPEGPCANCPIQRWATSDYYPVKTGGQFLRGLINAATCWLELPRSIFIDSRDGAPVVGTFLGVADGAAYTILRAGGGIIDIVTAIIPNYNNDLYRSEEEPIIFCDYFCK